jgi:O-antigen/teichoic acid export membrane protein
MDTRFRVKYGLNALITLINLGFPLASMWYAARVLGPDALGKYQFANALASQFLLLAGFGWSLYGSRQIATLTATAQRLAIAGEILKLNLVTTVMSLAAYSALVLMVPHLRPLIPVFAIAGLAVFANFFTTDFVLMGTEKYASMLWRSLLVKILAIFGIVIWVHGPEDLLVFCTILSLSVLCQNVLTFASLDLKLLFGQRPKWKSDHFSKALWIFLAIQVSNIHVNLDVFFVGVLNTPEIVAYYAAAIRTLRLGVAAMAYLGGAFIIRNAKQLGGDVMGLSVNSHASARLAIWLMVPVVGVCLARPDFVIQLLFGSGYQPAESVLRIASPIVLLAAVNHALGTQILIPLGKEKSLFMCGLAAASVGLGLLLPLSARWQHQGAAWATLAAECVALITVLFVTRGLRAPLTGLFPILIKCLTACAAGLALWYFGPFHKNFFSETAGALAAFVVYALVLALSGELRARGLHDRTHNSR